MLRHPPTSPLFPTPPPSRPQTPDAAPAGFLPPARPRRHHAAEPAAHEHSSLLGYQAPDGRRPLGLLRRAGGASDHGDERAPHRRPPLPVSSPNGGCSTPRSGTNPVT